MSLDINDLQYFKLIGQIQTIISKSTTLEEAIKQCLKLALSIDKADYAIIWNKDQDVLRPYYWIAPIDITAESQPIADSVVGKVYKENTTLTLLDYKNTPNDEIDERFQGINIDSYMCIPLSNTLEDIGCVELIKTDGQMSSEDADFYEILLLLIAMQIQENEALFSIDRHVHPIISVKDLKKEYVNSDFTTQVLKGVNIDVYEGEFLVLLGESGCGKSTLLNIISGMEQPTSGTITFFDQDISHASQDELTLLRRDNIGFIFQSYNLMPNLTVKQNLDLIAELVKEPMDSIEALSLVKLDHKTASYPSQLSGGQQQRVSIARALIKNPKIIMADEPTAALDYETSIEVLSSLEEVKRNGTTLVMVTHNEEITKMADRVIRMRNGKTYEVTINRHPVKAEELVW